MSDSRNRFSERIERRFPALTPLGYRVWRNVRHWSRRLMRKPRTVSESGNLLPLLIQVLAAFTKVDGQVLEEEIDSSLGFLRYDYPEAVYSELRRLFRQALNEQQDLTAMAQKLSSELSADRRIMLGVQLYDLISKAGMKQDQVIAYYSFMSQLGMAAQAIDIVYQLNATDHRDPEIAQKGASPLEALAFGPGRDADVVMHGLDLDERLLAFRYHELVLLKNQTRRPIVVRGRPVKPGDFCRIYSGQRIVLNEQVLTYQDLVYYFNAKKNVSVSQVYVAIDRNNEVELEKTQSRDSVLEITFGLKVQVKALRKFDVTLNNRRLRTGEVVEGTLEDKIIFGGDSELPLADLRRRARAMGARFQLKANKTAYLVSNNPSLLAEDDILLSPGTGGEVLLKISCDYGKLVGELEVLQADRPILIGETPVRNHAALADGDVICLDPGQVLRCDFTERIIEEERNVISTLEVRDLSHRFSNGELGLDNISLSANRGEMVCIMGASGSGKSTLMKVLAGLLPPTDGEILLNGKSLYDDHEILKRYLTYIPQDDAFDDHLTIEENLTFAAAIRAPHLSKRDRGRRIEGKLIELGLTERRGSIVGSPMKKTLSGGERKRLNMGLDMIGSADVYLFDEPTSGLSSKDSEHVIEIIRSMSHNKIVLVTIHQPTSKLFQMFNKAVLLDRGGRLVFHGTPSEMLSYFATAEHEQHFGTELGGCPACGTTRPEFIFDVLETPLRDLSGDIIYEENTQGQLVPARRFSPEYWRDKWESTRLLQDVRQIGVRRHVQHQLPQSLPKGAQAFRWRDEWVQFQVLLKRAFISKLRNRANLLTTIVEAPVLATLIGAVLRYSESGSYDFASAYHIPTYLFLGLIVAMFLGLTNSADDIIRDRPMLMRERNLNVRLHYYIFAKACTLALFAAIQCLLYVLIGNAILEIRGMFWIYFFYMFITAFSGISLGLLISALVADAKTAANIVPLVLIPQIILGGALIKYEEMNRDLDFVYTLKRWFSTQPVDDLMEMESELQVPLVCEFMPMRWSYEALVVAQAKLNPLTKRQRKIQDEIDAIVEMKPRPPEIRDRLEDLKDALAFLSGLEAGSTIGVDKRLERIDALINGEKVDFRALRTNKNMESAERMYVNRKTLDLVSKAETEQSDYRRRRYLGQEPPYINVFFGPEKSFFNWVLSVFFVNTVVLLSFSFASLLILYVSIRRQLTVRAR